MSEHDELLGISSLGAGNAKALGRIEATLEQHGVMLVNIENKATITNGRVTAAEKAIALSDDRAAQIATIQAARATFKHNILVAATSGTGVLVLTLLAKLLVPGA
jgi:hypothetical protein